MSKEQNKRIRKLKKQADDLWKIKVMEKYGRVCTICPNIASDPHHYFIKGNFSNLRYSLENGVPLCRKHHMDIHNRQDPDVIARIISRRGQKWHDDLTEQSKKPAKSWKSIEYYKEIIKKLEAL